MDKGPNRRFGRMWRAARVAATSALYVAVGAAPRVAGFILIPIYAWVLSPAELATYSIGIALIQALALVSELGITPIAVRAYFRTEGEIVGIAAFERVVLVSRVAAIGLLLAFAPLAYLSWSALTGGLLPAWQGVALILLQAFLLRSNIFLSAVWRVRDQHIKFLLARLVSPVAQILFGIALVFAFENKLLAAFCALPLGQGIGLLVNTLTMRGELKPRWADQSWALLWSYVRSGFPVFLSQATQWGQRLGARPLLALFVPLGDVAKFVVAMTVATMVAPLINAIGMYLGPIVYRAHEGADEAALKRIDHTTSVMLAIGSLGCVVAACILPFVTRLALPAAYEGLELVIAIIICGLFIEAQNTVVGQRRIARGNTSSFATGSGIGLAVSFAIFPLALYVGIVAAALSYLVYAFVRLIFVSLSDEVSRRYSSVREGAIASIGTAVLATAGAYAFSDRGNNIERAGFILVAAVLYLAIISTVYASIKSSRQQMLVVEQ